MRIDLFDCASPLDFRYYGADEDLMRRLGPYVSERGRVASELRAEVALCRTLAREGLCPEDVAEQVAQAAEQVTPEEVAEEEARIKHNIRALVNCLHRKVSDRAKPYVHFLATSFDIIDTATAWRFRQAAEQVLIPDLKELLQVLIELARREKDTVQIGRTHGQHAVPVTFGFAIANYVDRLGERIEAIRKAADDLPGKFSGAVGAYNSSSLFIEKPGWFEHIFLEEMGEMEPMACSTQIVHPEPMADFVHALVTTFGVLADFADDMRHLQRTEIGEVGEAFAAEQVGSSTMPQKRNPITFENVKSLWKAMMPRMVTVYLDQLSEHQRDLTNSASQRFLPEIIVALAVATKRLTDVCGRLVTDRERMRQNLQMSAGAIAAEPAYLLLAAHGHPDAHEAVRRIAQAARETGDSFWEALNADADLQPYLGKLTDQQRSVLQHPETYIGQAAETTESVCRWWHNWFSGAHAEEVGKRAEEAGLPKDPRERTKP